MKKMITIALFAVTITFALFAFMAFLIGNDQGRPVVQTPVIIVDIMQTPPESTLKQYTRIKHTPPPTPKQPPTTDIEPEPTAMDNTITFAAPKIQSAQIKAGLSNAPGSPDRNARPVIRVNPRYPVKAARNGIEGWVKLTFNITPLGDVVDIKVLDSWPKRIFDKAAKQALKKWKYQGKKQNGDQIMQHGLTVQLDFNIDKTAS